jgi:hypothetical protein
LTQTNEKVETGLKETAKSQADIDWENRTLCVDESCIGVIGPDGRCKECGLPLEGEPPGETPEATEARDLDPATEKETEQDADSDSDSDWENRTLCMDESCIGVIGPDGRCKECGLPFENE